MNTPSLDDLLAAHQAGNPETVRFLAEYCNEHVQRIARRLTRRFPGVARHDRPSDVAQESLPRLLQALATTKIESERHLRALAAKKVRETLIDLARKHAGANRGLDNLQSQGDAPPERHAAMGAIDDASGPATLDEWARFQQAIDALPEAEREVFMLKWFLDASDHDIADTLGVSESTAQRRWSAAKQLVKAAMDGERPR